MTSMIRNLLIVGAIVVGLLALRYLFGHWYLATENANFAEYHKKSRLNCSERVLHCAIRDDDKKLFKYAMDRNDDLEAKDGWGQSPLFYSVKHSKSWFTKELIRLGADPDSRDDQDITVLHLAVKRTDLDITRLLLEIGANPNELIGDWKGTALHTAVHQDDIEIAKLLLKHGADAQIRNASGRSVIDKIQSKSDSIKQVVDTKGND